MFECVFDCFVLTISGHIEMNALVVRGCEVILVTRFCSNLSMEIETSIFVTAQVDGNGLTTLVTLCGHFFLLFLRWYSTSAFFHQFVLFHIIHATNTMHVLSHVILLHNPSPHHYSLHCPRLP